MANTISESEKLAGLLDSFLSENNATEMRLSDVKKNAAIRKALGIKSNASIERIAEAVRTKLAGRFEIVKVGRAMWIRKRVNQTDELTQDAPKPEQYDELKQGTANDTKSHTQRKVIRVLSELTRKTKDKSVSAPTLYKAMGWKSRKFDDVLWKMAKDKLISLKYAPLDADLVTFNDCPSRYREHRIKLSDTG